MIPHHAQALEMAKLVPSRSTNPKVLDLARRIEAAQEPEIRQMTGWLSAWDAPVPSTTAGMDHGGHGSMPGTMTAEQMKQLTQVRGTEFDRRWLEMMIAHHQGAVEMAKTEQGAGGSAQAKAVAKKIIDGQQAEIAEMRGLLKPS